MTSTLVDKYYRPHEGDVSEYIVDNDVYTLPVWPKIGIIINFNAALWTVIAILLTAVMRRSEDIQHIVDLTNLMACFFIGSITAVVSSWFDSLARRLYKTERARKKGFVDWASVFDFSALGVMLASMGIFAWGLWRGGSILGSMFF